MTLINALEELKAKGITKLSGMYNTNDIDKYIENAQACHDLDVKWSDVECHKYSIDHENDHFMIEISDGHYIIATTYATANRSTCRRIAPMTPQKKQKRLLTHGISIVRLNQSQTK